MERTRPVVLVGAIPPPIGGVASHVHRLAQFLASNGTQCTVLDPYPAQWKVATPGVHHVRFDGRTRWLRLALHLHKITRHSDAVLHLHFSRLVGRFAALAILCSRRGQTVFLTVHNGDQASAWRDSSILRRQLARLGLRRVSKIMAISSEQVEFFKAIGVSAARVRMWPGVVPACEPADPSVLPAEVSGIRAIEDGGSESVLITSGYPRESYGYELCIELLDRLCRRIDARLVVCLYGEASDSSYEQGLRRRLDEHPRIVVLGPIPFEGFIALLARCSVYLRPSTEDSYGLAVTEALDVGTPCLASDICRRDPRAETYPTANTEAFLAKAAAIVERGRTAGRRGDIRSRSMPSPSEFLEPYHVCGLTP